MATVYIIYSKSIDKFYIGSCKDFSVRLDQHNNHVFNKSFTLRAIDEFLLYKNTHQYILNSHANSYPF